MGKTRCRCLPLRLAMVTARDDDDGTMPTMLRLPARAKRLPDRGGNCFVTDLELLTKTRLTARARASAVGRFWRVSVGEPNPSLTAVVAVWLDDPDLEFFAMLVEALLLPAHAARRMTNHGYRLSNSAASGRKAVGAIQRPIQQDEAGLRRRGGGAAGRRSGVSGGNRTRWVAQALHSEE